MGYGIEYFGNKSVKDITYAALEDFSITLPERLSSKTKFDIIMTLRCFWNWLLKRKVITIVQYPEFPELQYECEMRKILDKPTQEAILEEIKRISFRHDPKIYLAIQMLATYVSVRPIELLQVKEKDFDLNLGLLYIRKTKDNRTKRIPLHPEHLETIRSFPRGIGELFFFRHPKREGIAERYVGDHYRQPLLNKWWKKACQNLKINFSDMVSLYPGTRHTSTSNLRMEGFSPEEIRRGTGHTTNKCFERYYMQDLSELQKLYAATKPKEIENQGGKTKGKVLALKST